MHCPVSKKTYTLVLTIALLFICNPGGSAQSTSSDKALLKDSEFFFGSGDSKNSTPSNSLTRVYRSPGNNPTKINVFQKSGGGFVLIGERDDKYVVMGYSPDGEFPLQSIPYPMQVLIQGYESFSELPDDRSLKLSKATIIVSPLLNRESVSLNQYLHPEAGGCPTGCTATAMTQIMAYYKYPDHGIGSKCYTHSRYGTLCADFENTVFDWNNMTQADYQLLSFQVAIAMEMDFCGHRVGSIPRSPAYGKVLEDYYGYHVHKGSKELYYLTNELDNERPAYVAIPGDPGHAVVVDGYDSDGYFHINFGWEGRFNGYYRFNSGELIQIGPLYTGYTFGSNISSAWYVSKEQLWTSEEDSLALVAIHNSLNGTTGWNISTPVITWQGVVVPVIVLG